MTAATRRDDAGADRWRSSRHVELVDFIHSISREEDDDLQGWFSGCWPALTHNKPATTIALLRDICMDKKMGLHLIQWVHLDVQLFQEEISIPELNTAKP